MTIFKMTLQEILGLLEMENPDALLMEPRDRYDACIVGIGHRFNDGPLVMYSIERILGVLEADGMTGEEAVEWYHFNILGAWVGEGTPIFVQELLPVEDEELVGWI